MDLIGCLSKPRDFLAVGTAEQEMLGCCEAYWKEDMVGRCTLSVRNRFIIVLMIYSYLILK